jgi:hypothetical protein
VGQAEKVGQVPSPGALVGGSGSAAGAAQLPRLTLPYSDLWLHFCGTGLCMLLWPRFMQPRAVSNARWWPSGIKGFKSPSTELRCRLAQVFASSYHLIFIAIR